MPAAQVLTKHRNQIPKTVEPLLQYIVIHNMNGVKCLAAGYIKAIFWQWLSRVGYMTLYKHLYIYIYTRAQTVSARVYISTLWALLKHYGL